MYGIIMILHKVCKILIIIFCAAVQSKLSRKLPHDLLIGAATSSYQIEGAWNEDDKGESIWDRLVHTKVAQFQDNADIACDSYHKLPDDVAMLKELGLQHYRFSISWSRILPNGFTNKINQAGINYYNKLIDGLLSEGIVPMVTMYHWDLPQVLQDLGGWVNPNIAFWFEDYAEVLFQQFGDRVKTWITINEPKQVCYLGYGIGLFAPGVSFSGQADYMCTRNLLLAHSKVYHSYVKRFKHQQKGRIGITVDCSWSEAGTNSKDDEEAAHRVREFEFGIYTHPIFHKNGDYPDIVKETVHKRSLAEGFSISRLPKLSQEEIDFIKGTSDFFGLNHYTTSLVKAKEMDPVGDPSRAKDVHAYVYADPTWVSGSLSYVRSVPWGMRKTLNYIKTNYDNPEIVITETGFPDYGEFDDKDRIKYYKGSLGAVLDAIGEDAVNVTGYTVWSLMDNFEWMFAYTTPFGLYHVNFTDPNRPRTPKSSCNFFKNLLQSRTFLTYDNE